MARETGYTSWFNNAEGHGIIRADRGDDLFVHFAHIAMEGFKTLAAGQRVEFDRVPQPGPDGTRDVAMFVVPLGS